MNKEQATQYILTHLQADYSPEEISVELSKLLKAPPATTRRFVDQVIVERPELAPLPSVAEENNPPERDVYVPNGYKEIESPTTPQAIYQDLPPGLQAIINGEPVSAPAMEPVPRPGPGITPKVAAPPKSAFETPLQANNNTVPGITTSDIDLEALSEAVLKKLKIQSRQNDIIEFVCHETDWHWNQAQRFVARVKTENHGQLQGINNTITLVIGIGTILAGLILTLNGATMLNDYAKILLATEIITEYEVAGTARMLIPTGMALVTGIGMILGGGYGIARVLNNR